MNVLKFGRLLVSRQYGKSLVLQRNVSLETKAAEKMKRHKELCELYQFDKTVPIHLKRGLPDFTLFYVTAFLCVANFMYCSNAIYGYIYPKKK